VLFEYPVYVSDLKPVGFQVVSLGDRIACKEARGLVTVERERLEAAVRDVTRYLKDPAARRAAVDHNFLAAAEHFSLQTLASILDELLLESGIAPL
jgi:hypothetical protein